MYLKCFLRLLLGDHSKWDVRNSSQGNSLAVQWLGLHALTVKGPDSVPGGGTKILQAEQCGQKREREREMLSRKHASKYFMLFSSTKNYCSFMKLNILLCYNIRVSIEGVNTTIISFWSFLYALQFLGKLCTL